MSRLLLVLRRVRRRLLIHRRGLAALLAGLAVFTVVRTTAPPPPETRPVWTAAVDLPAGHVVAPGDLRQVGYLPASVPAATAGPADLVGRTLAAPVGRGTPFSRSSVVGPHLLPGGDTGTVAVPVRVSDPDVVDLLRVGDRVDLLASSPDRPGEARLVTTGARVLAVPRVRDAPVSTDLPGRLVVLEITSEAEEKVVALGVSGFLAVTWSR